MSPPEEFDDDFSEDQDSKQNETPQMDKVLFDAINGVLYDLHTAMPAQVVAIRGNSYVDIQPMLKRKYATGRVVNLPVIQNVPICVPRGADYAIKVPIAVGDTGFAIFSERSIDRWSVAGGLVDPKDSRRHDLSDAVFYPGLYPMDDQVEGAADDMVLQNGDAQLTIQKSGKFKLANEDQELLNILVQLVDTLKTASTVAGGPFTPDVVTTLTQMSVNLATLKGS